MRLDTLGLETKKYYWHHYNFPPFSVGEAGRMGGVKRRDIGHGALAERALAPMVPSIEEFPYTIRVVSDILESNGSSSMASVCGSSLSLMDAGVPIERPVAGIAMGLIKEGDDYIVLTDIAGVEDHLGDMDFKVAGTERGITALQMDIKITGVTFDILRDALPRRTRRARSSFAKMADVIQTPREQLSQFAPRIQTIQIDPSQIGLLDRQGRGNDQGAVGGVRVSRSTSTTMARSRVLGQRRSRRRARGAHQGDDEGGRGRRRVRRQGRQDDDVRRVRGADQGHRRPLAHLQRLPGRARGVRSRTCSTAAMRSACAWSRSTASAAASACVSPRTRRSPASPSRSSRASPPVVAGVAAAGLPAMALGATVARVVDAAAAAAAAAVLGARASAARVVPGTGPGAIVSAREGRARRGAASGHPDEMTEHRTTTLQSGVRVITERIGNVRSVALGFWIGAGSATESDAQAGTSHLLEHMLFRGTERYRSHEIDELFDAMGAEINAGTDRETTSLYTRVMDRHLERAFDVAAEMIWRPRFESLQAEREVVLEEIAMYEDDPQDRVFDVLGEAVFGSHPLGRAVIGTAAVVGAVTREQLQAFHSERYAPQRIVIAAAGSVDHDALVEDLRRRRSISDLVLVFQS